MPADSTRDGRAPVWARRVYLANLVAQMAIVLTGGLVRLTGSGLGCPTWPRCVPGSFTPVPQQAQEWHKYVEFGNRTLTFLLLVLAGAALVAAALDARARRAAQLPARPALTWLAAVPLAGTLAQAVLGGISVLTDLNPLVVAGHLVLSMAIIGGCALLVTRAGEPADEPVVVVVRREARALAVALVALAGLVVVLGTLVTGSGPHAGDESAPRLGLDPRTMSWLHADVVIAYLGVLLGLLLLLRVTDAPDRPRRAALVALVVALAQGAIGYLQYFTGLPWAVVALHLVGATLVWLTAVQVLLATRTRGVAAAIALPVTPSPLIMD